MELNFKKYFILFAVFWIQTTLFAQSYNSGSKSQWLKENDRVCYIGNSITAAGDYCFFIDLYMHTRYPNLKFETFNCGISGNTAKDVLTRMNSDILIHNPTIATLKLGMNDVHRDLYSLQNASPEILLKRKEALLEYSDNMKKIADELTAQNCKIIFLTPTIYDQTAKIEAANNLGVNEALKECADIVKGLANKYHSPIVDFYTPMEKINSYMQLKDPTYTLIGKDRVHPGLPGHLVMAFTYLTALHSDSIVSKIAIDANENKVEEQINCQIQKLKSDNKTISFDALSYSLPFPFLPDSRSVLELVPFNQRLNQEVLKVNNLAIGDFILTIDQDTIGVFSNSELIKGINLALYEKTPQYKQAANVMDILWKQHQLESKKLRIMAMIEQSALKELYNPEDLDEAKILLDAELEKMRGKDYYDWMHDRYADYLEMKPQEKKIKEEIKRMGSEINEEIKPKSHQYKLTLTN